MPVLQPQKDKGQATGSGRLTRLQEWNRVSKPHQPHVQLVHQFAAASLEDLRICPSRGTRKVRGSKEFERLERRFQEVLS